MPGGNSAGTVSRATTVPVHLKLAFLELDSVHREGRLHMLRRSFNLIALQIGHDTHHVRRLIGFNRPTLAAVVNLRPRTR